MSETDTLDVLYLYESAKAIRVLTMSGVSLWIPINLIHNEWIRDTEITQTIEIEMWFVLKYNLNEGY